MKKMHDLFASNSQPDDDQLIAFEVMRRLSEEAKQAQAAGERVSIALRRKEIEAEVKRRIQEDFDYFLSLRDAYADQQLVKQELWKKISEKV